MFKLLFRALVFSLLAALLPTFVLRAALPQPAVLSAILSTSPNWVTDGVDNGVQFGLSVDSAGDVNGDGYADGIVGAQKYLVSGSRSGSAFVFLGGPAGLSTTAHRQLTTNDPGSYFGGSVAGAGDVNGDGYDDVIVGAPHVHVDIEYNGAAYLYLGSAAGLSDSPAWSYTGINESQFGASVCGAGDVNGDGYDDVLVGATRLSQTENNEGGAYLFLGSESGLAASPAWSVQSNQISAQLGYDLAALGDLNHDTYADIAVSAPYYDTVDDTDAGLVWVFLGSASGLSLTPDWTAMGVQGGAWFGSSIDGAGDVDGNDYVDLIVGARGYDGAQVDIGAAYLFYNGAGGLSPTSGWFVTSSQTVSGFGTAVGGLGDVNMDGYDDVGVGAPKYDDDQPDEGFVFVYNGGPTGASSSPNWSASGNKAETDFGYSLAAAGDVNADGRADLILGAPIYKRDEKTVMGRAYVFHGMATGDLPFYKVYLPAVMR